MILIVDDDAAVRASLAMLLRHAGYDTAAADGPASAVEAVRRATPQLVLLDMNFSRFTTGDEGLTLLRQFRLIAPSVPVILMTAWGSIDLAVEGMRAGAFDFITKPWDNRRLLARIATALDMSATPDAGTFDRSMIIGESPALRSVLDTVARVAPTSAPVLITGESGTGKELIAEAIHRNSTRRSGPFVKVNLGGLSQSLFESEMFGHVKGAFTDAVSDRTGRFEAADGGTIFLDEIGELDPVCQVKLLRVLQEQRFERLGSSTTRSVDVRVVCATNADLRAMVVARTFREDLYYRINLVGVELPPLRARGADIPLLARHFAAEAARRHGLAEPQLLPDAAAYLASLPWPGNIRELKNLVERTIIISGKDALGADDFRRSGGEVSTASVPSGTLDAMERSRIADVLAACGGNISRAAAQLGLSRAALYRRMEKYDLKP